MKEQVDQVNLDKHNDEAQLANIQNKMQRTQQELQEKNQFYENTIQNHMNNFQKQQQILEYYEKEKQSITEAQRDKELEILNLNSKE